VRRLLGAPDLAAGLGVLRRDFLMMKSYRTTAVSSVISLVLGLALFHFLSRLVRIETFESPDAYYAYVVVGLVILQVLNSTFMTLPGGVRQELVAGTFERLVLSPFGAVRAILASSVFPLLYATVTGLFMLLIARAAFGMPVRWETLPLAIPVGMLAALSFAPFGLFACSTVLIFKQAMSGMTWIVAGMAIVAGLYFPVALLPDWLRWASDVQPFTPAVELLRHLYVGTPLTHPAWLSILKLAGFCAALLPLSLFAVHRALRVAARRGTITEY
jgi:ABC-2 type transport system permease protein